MEEQYSIHARDDGDDDDDDGSRISREGAADQADRGRRTHNRSVFDPPPSRFELLRKKIWKYFDVLCIFWKRVRNDPYQWSLFKSILWFTVGLKLFNDMARHAKVSALFGGVPPPEPPKKPCPPKIITCHSKPDRRSSCLKSDKVRQPLACRPKPEPPKANPCSPAKESDKGCEDAYDYCG